MSVSQQVRIHRCKPAQAAGTTAITSDLVDLEGFDRALFLVLWESVQADGVQGVKVQGSHDGSRWKDLEEASVSVSDHAESAITYLELKRPTYRYVRAVVSRVAEGRGIDGIVALLTGPKPAAGH